MKPRESKLVFESRLTQQGLVLATLTADQSCGAMLEFYRSQRAEGCHLATDGDMLLYQWDFQDSTAHRRCLEWNLTRQFILEESSYDESDEAIDDDDEPIWQLSLTLRFPLNGETGNLISGSKWCRVPRPQAVDHFEKFIRESAAHKLAATLTAVSVELEYFNAG